MDALDHFWLTFSTLFVFSLGVLYFARKLGFFQLPPSTTSGVRSLHLLTGFGIYLFLAFFFFPSLLLLLRTVTPLAHEGPWLQCLYISLIFGFLYLLFWKIFPSLLHKIFWGEAKNQKKTFWRGLKMGLITWLVSYPIVLSVNLLTTWLGTLFWGESGVEQVAVSQLKDLETNKIAYWITALFIITLVPLIEELLFRGLLQSWLKNFLGRRGAIFLTAALFSLVHFSSHQKAVNFELISSLFVLSCFLGFIYEREKTLWASITLHALFNGATVFMLSAQ